MNQNILSMEDLEVMEEFCVPPIIGQTTQKGARLRAKQMSTMMSDR